MKKIFTILIFISLLFLANEMVLAQGPTTEISNVLNKIKTYLWTFLGTVAVIAIIWGAYLFVTAGGDTQKIAAAKNAVIWAIIGMVVAVMASGIIDLVKSLQ
jgi:lysylphosphatidylglycerol synthetase-like protein (DUF2156 family)